MKFELDPLPYEMNALEPHISARTLEFHYGKHHQTYLDKLQGLIKDDPLADQSLEEIIRHSSGGVFNNAAQVWNHSFYWNSMAPDGGGEPEGELARLISSEFGSIDDFKEKFSTAAKGAFGSGWAWLVVTPDKRLQIVTTSNADNPLCQDHTPLLTLDVWEHAYYLDYQNKRPDYVQAFLEHLVNWQFAQENLEKTR